MKNNVGMIFYLDQFTSGNVIHLDEFQFELPSPKSFPPEDDPCLELVTNGDAEDTDGRGWHHYPMWTHDQNKYTPVIKEETLADGSVNKYWHIGYRNWIGDSLRFNVNPACLALNNKYTLSLRVRFSGKSSHSTRYWFEIKGTTQKNGFRYNKPLYCPQQSPADGWVTCSGELVVTDDYVFTSKPEIIFVTMDEGNVPVENLHLWDYDDVSIRFKSGVSRSMVQYLFIFLLMPSYIQMKYYLFSPLKDLKLMLLPPHVGATILMCILQVVPCTEKTPKMAESLPSLRRPMGPWYSSWTKVSIPSCPRKIPLVKVWR